MCLHNFKNKVDGGREQIEASIASAARNRQSAGDINTMEDIEEDEEEEVSDDHGLVYTNERILNTYPEYFS